MSGKYDSDLTDEQWRLIKPSIPRASKRGRAIAFTRVRHNPCVLYREVNLAEGTAVISSRKISAQ